MGNRGSIKDIYDNHQDLDSDYIITEGTTLKQIWDKFWDDADKLGLNMDLGGEVIQETIIDWMIDKELLAILEDDGWLDD